MRAPRATFSRARALRSKMTLPEVVLWQMLRRGGLAKLHFRRQHPVGPYVLDFYCAAVRLAVEVDGEFHGTDEGTSRDRHRDEFLAAQGIRVFRVTARDVLDDEQLEGVVLAIAQVAGVPILY
ncbi:MAG TPA: endonuclease domain-containing protein [Hyphomicrobiales bacterium]|nr:endonuclease domain-containing protein [Hyphomicrobiales bacterium]